MFATVVVVIWAGSTVSRSTPTATRKVPAAPAGAGPTAIISAARATGPSGERKRRVQCLRMSVSSIMS